MKTTLRVIFSFPKLILLILLLVFFFIFEGIMLLIYASIESPLRYILSILEKAIRLILKNLT